MRIGAANLLLRSLDWTPKMWELSEAEATSNVIAGEKWFV